MIVAPSILSADFNKLLEEVNTVDNAQYIHIDVMDGHFVPNISFGTCVFKNLRKFSKKIFDVHLMIEHPLFYVQDFHKAGADIITIHYECSDDLQETIKHIKSFGKKVGMSIKPKTDVSVLIPYLDSLDLILIMSVEPGFGGQKFMPEALNKINTLAKLKRDNDYHYLIEVDGGINYDTAKECAKAGCEVVVAGTYIFKAENKRQLIEELKSL